MGTAKAFDAMSVSAAKMAVLKADVLGEVVAGLIWMHLSLPEDASRGEVEDCAAGLVRAARKLGAGACGEIYGVVPAESAAQRGHAGHRP